MKTYSIDNPSLVPFLRRPARFDADSYKMDLKGVFCEILRRANDFVPSASGFILLEDPATAAEEGGRCDELVVVAGFGDKGMGLMGARLAVKDGIAGRVYTTGEATLSATPEMDRVFYHLVQTAKGFTLRSVICVPLEVEGRVIGVLELLNHREEGTIGERELELLKLFAHTISASIANATEAHRSKEMARRDDLTGLFNDRYLHHHLSALLDSALERDQECGVIFIDLDHFKSVNDKFGHLAGSRVLRELGQILRRILPPQAVPARYGGDEFVILLPEASDTEIYWVAETIRQTIERQVFLARPDPDDPVNCPAINLGGVVTCSLGYATLKRDVLPALGGGDVDPVAAKNELLKLADASMYRAKALGKNLTMSAADHSE